MNEPQAISVLIVDDHPLFRQGVVQSLASAPDMTVVGEASCGEEALKLACELLPDIVLLDINMPGWDGLHTAERIAAACPAIAIVMLTMAADRDKLLGAFKAGARAYVDSAHAARSSPLEPSPAQPGRLSFEGQRMVCQDSCFSRVSSQNRVGHFCELCLADKQ